MLAGRSGLVEELGNQHETAVVLGTVQEPGKVERPGKSAVERPLDIPVTVEECGTAVVAPLSPVAVGIGAVAVGSSHWLLPSRLASSFSACARRRLGEVLVPLLMVLSRSERREVARLGERRFQQSAPLTVLRSGEILWMGSSLHWKHG